MRTVIATTVIAAAALLAACASNDQVQRLEQQVSDLEQQVIELEQATPQYRDVLGTVTTKFGATKRCLSNDNKVTFNSGDRISIHDGSDEVLAVDRLSGRSYRDDTCIFVFKLPDVPTSGGFYIIRLNGFSWEFNGADFEESEWRPKLDTRN